MKAAALRSIVLRYAGAPIATRGVYAFLLLFNWRCSFFRVFFVPFPHSLCMESTSYVFSFRMVFFYLVTTGWIFDIISLLCKNSINQSCDDLFFLFSLLCVPCCVLFFLYFLRTSTINTSSVGGAERADCVPCCVLFFLYFLRTSTINTSSVGGAERADLFSFLCSV